MNKERIRIWGREFILERREMSIHIFGWTIYFIVLINFFSTRFILEEAFIRAVFLLIPLLFIVYLNMEVFTPRYFIRKKYLIYGICILGALAILVWFNQLFDYPPPEKDLLWQRMQVVDDTFKEKFRIKPNFLAFRHMPTLFHGISVLVFSTAYKTVQLLNRKEQEATELKNEKLDAELKFLKSQINPHFLFNALNNVYALSIIKSDDTPEVVLKLSNMLRYLLYECKADEVALKHEIAYISDYIELIKLRDEEIHKNIVIEIDVDDQLMIAPMLLVPFIENSFKHSKIEDVENSWVHIHLQTKETYLHFNIQNSLPKLPFTKDEVGGIGLGNVKRRLNLIYPNQHNLSIQKEYDSFNVELTINLSSP